MKLWLIFFFLNRYLGKESCEVWRGWEQRSVFLHSLTTQIISNHRTVLGFASGRLDSPKTSWAASPYYPVYGFTTLTALSGPLKMHQPLVVFCCSAFSWAFLTKGKVPYRHKMKMLDYLIKNLSAHPQKSAERHWSEGKKNNTLTWLLLSSSEELPGHHRLTCKSIGSGAHLPVML